MSIEANAAVGPILGLEASQTAVPVQGDCGAVQTGGLHAMILASPTDGWADPTRRTRSQPAAKAPRSLSENESTTRSPGS